jgi:alpha-tubulin suppressor-like RCC1 family protein
MRNSTLHTVCVLLSSLFILSVSGQARAGSVVGWGNNDYGRATPPSVNDFVAISTRGLHSLALKTDGSIVGWGYNRRGAPQSRPEGRRQHRGMGA